MDKALGFLTPVMIFMIIFILNLLLPGRWVTGYVTKKNSAEKLRYHLNGIYVFIVVVLTWFLLGFLNIVPFEWLYNTGGTDWEELLYQVSFFHSLWYWLILL